MHKTKNKKNHIIVIMIFESRSLCSNSNKSGCLIFLILFLITLNSCQSNTRSLSGSHKNSAAIVPAANDYYFQEIGKEIGLDFIHSIGDKELTNIVESSGAGAAFLDYDQDGYIDLYLSLIHISEPTRLGMISYAVF